jgi:HK97 family phage major capsid protein
MNQELLKKADLAIANLVSNGGLLNPEQADTFYRTLIDQPTIINAARTVPMNAPSLQINKIGFGSRILRAAQESTALTAAQRAKPDLGQVTLNTHEVMAEVRIPYGVLEDNIERGNMETTILTLIAERAALDLEELIIRGDTASQDSYLALFDGLLKRVTSHTYDATETHIQPVTFSNALKALPAKYKRNKNLLRFFSSVNVEQDWRNAITQRQTIGGDAAIAGQIPTTIHGVGLVPVALMPDDKAILIDPQNILIGIQRNFRLEAFRIIAERTIQFVLTARVAFNLEEEPASVLINNLSA